MVINMNPLAYELRPKTIDDIVGQNHLVGPNGAIRKMINNKRIPSLILFGDPGIGKTTLAKVIINSLNVKSDTFNASSDNKEKLKTLIEKDNVDFLIIDEILAVGDLAFQRKCYDKLNEMKEKGTTFIIVSHSDVVKDLCTRAIWLKDGKVEMNDNINEVYDEYKKYLETTE